MLNTIKSITFNRLGLVQYPSFVTFFITWKCNCRCVMCDIWKKKIYDELNLNEIEDIFKQLKYLDAVRITGGEPFLRKDLSEIINVIDKHTNLIHITTNGLLTENIINTINNINSKKKIHIKISIDGIGKEHDKIRGVSGAYDKALKTVELLSKMRDKHKFYLGVDQTIVNKKGLSSYKKLKSILKKYNVKIHPVIAYDNLTALYSDKGNLVSPEKSYRPFGDFSKIELEILLKTLIEDANEIKNFKERLIKKYYLKGLFNRLIKNIRKPNPKCVALHSHLRILPNGDAPVCMYNSMVIGNLKKNKFKEIWFGQDTDKYRTWIKNCKGCWAGCESNINGIYSGDVWRGL